MVCRLSYVQLPMRTRFHRRPLRDEHRRLSDQQMWKQLHLRRSDTSLRMPVFTRLHGYINIFYNYCFFFFCLTFTRETLRLIDSFPFIAPGDYCQTKIQFCSKDFNPCHNGAKCVDHVTHYTCECPLGFSGDNCTVNNDDCQNHMCQVRRIRFVCLSFRPSR